VTTFPVRRLIPNDSEFPAGLLQLPQPPEQLYVAGARLDHLLTAPSVAIVGSRKVTPYGRQTTERLASELASLGVTIISGLALGVDGLAHEAALAAGGRCLVVLPGPIDTIVPRRHLQLAERILAQGGALVSEYAPGMPILKHFFVARNRIVAGLAQAVIIPEAGLKSGSLHTAGYALEQGIDVLAVPGNISNPMSVGTNNLLKRSARPLTGVDDVLQTLGLERVVARPKPRGASPAEQMVLELIDQGVNDGSKLLEDSQLVVSDFNQTLTMLEIRGLVRPLGANHWARP
jgi:DNA processing protein